MIAAQQPTSLQHTIVDAAQCMFQRLGQGFTENVYRDALAVELERRRINVSSDREVICPVRYASRYVGFCRSDIVLLCAERTEEDETVSELHNDDDNVEPRDYFTRGLIKPSVVIELKATHSSLTAANMQQLNAYLRVLDVERGILINFDQRDAVLREEVGDALARHHWRRRSNATKPPTAHCVVLPPSRAPLREGCRAQVIFACVGPS